MAISVNKPKYVFADKQIKYMLLSCLKNRMAFMLRKTGKTQGTLAKAIGFSQTHLSLIRNAKNADYMLSDNIIRCIALSFCIDKQHSGWDYGKELRIAEIDGEILRVTPQFTTFADITMYQWEQMYLQDMNEKMINEKRPLTDIINNESVSNSSVSPVVPDNSVKQPETKMPPKEMQYNYFSAVNNAEQQAERKETAKPIQKPAEKSIADSLQDVIKAESESDEFTGIPARKSKDEGFTIKAAPDEEVIITISIKRIKINAGK